MCPTTRRYSPNITQHLILRNENGEWPEHHVGDTSDDPFLTMHELEPSYIQLGQAAVGAGSLYLVPAANSRECVPV